MSWASRILRLGMAVGAAVAAFPAQASPRVEATPYLEFQQVLTADLDGGEVLTYTTVAAGLDARAQTRRVEAQISYRYEHHFAWGDGEDEDVHSGVAQMRFEAVDEILSLDAGALAARADGDGGPAFGFDRVGGDAAEIYSVYAGPTLSTQFGPFSVGAAYRIGYVRVDDDDFGGTDRFDSSVLHNATASIGMEPGELPFGWTIGAGYAREDANRFDHEFTGAYVRGDIVVPVSPHLAVTAGIGYEDIESSQQDILRGVDGLPVIGPGGDLFADPSLPRLVTYDEDGIIWDAGFIWRPSRRTELQARVGERYGGLTFTGAFRHRLNGSWGVQAMVYDSVSSFGQLLIEDVAALPSGFEVNRNPLMSGVAGVGGCVFGSDPGSGVCFDDALQSFRNSDFRIRGAQLVLSGGRGAWDYGFGAGYNRRRYFGPDFGPGFLSFDGIVEESFSLSAFASRAIDFRSGVSFDAYAGRFDSNRIDRKGETFAGVGASYHRRMFHDRMQGFAAFSLQASDGEGDFETSATGLVGLRYTF